MNFLFSLFLMFNVTLYIFNYITQLFWTQKVKVTEKNKYIKKERTKLSENLEPCFFIFSQEDLLKVIILSSIVLKLN